MPTKKSKIEKAPTNQKPANNRNVETHKEGDIEIVNVPMAFNEPLVVDLVLRV